MSSTLSSALCISRIPNRTDAVSVLLTIREKKTHRLTVYFRDLVHANDAVDDIRRKVTEYAQKIYDRLLHENDWGTRAAMQVFARELLGKDRRFQLIALTPRTMQWRYYYLDECHQAEVSYNNLLTYLSLFDAHGLTEKAKQLIVKVTKADIARWSTERRLPQAEITQFLSELPEGDLAAQQGSTTPLSPPVPCHEVH